MAAKTTEHIISLLKSFQLSLTLTLTYRFMAVVYPLRPQLQTRDAKKVIGIIWVFALALVSPYIAVLEMNAAGTECEEYFHEKGLNAGGYTISIFLLQYVVPLSIIGLSYIR